MIIVPGQEDRGEQGIIKEELALFLREHGMALVEEEGWPKEGALNKVYRINELAPQSSDKPMSYVLKVPQPRSLLHTNPFGYDGIRGKSQAILNMNARIKQKRIRHPQVPMAEVLWFSYHGERIPLVLEDYAPGITLEELAKSADFLGFSTREKANIAINIYYQLAGILRHFEDNKIYHNDIKPANVVVDLSRGYKELKAYLLDMNVSKDYGSEERFVGSAFFSAPEIVVPKLGEGVNNLEARSDIFSLGMTIYYLMKGRACVGFEGGKTPELREEMLKILKDKGEFRRSLSFLGMPKAVRRVLKRSLQYEPTKRYSGFSELEHELYNSLPAISSQKKRRRVFFWGGVSMALLLGISFGLTRMLCSVYNFTRRKTAREVSEKIVPFLEASVKGVRRDPEYIPTDKEEQKFPLVSCIKPGTNEAVYKPFIYINPETQKTRMIFPFPLADTGFLETFSLEFKDLFMREKFSSECNDWYEMKASVGDIRFKPVIGEDGLLYIREIYMFGPHDLSSVVVFSQNYANGLVRIEEQTDITLKVTPWSFAFKPDGFDAIPKGLSMNDPAVIRKREELPTRTEVSYFEYLKGILSRGWLAAPLDIVREEGYIPKYLIVPKAAELPMGYNVRWRIATNQEPKYSETDDSNNNPLDLHLRAMDEWSGVIAEVYRGKDHKGTLTWRIYMAPKR